MLRPFWLWCGWRRHSPARRGQSRTAETPCRQSAPRAGAGGASGRPAVWKALAADQLAKAAPRVEAPAKRLGVGVRAGAMGGVRVFELFPNVPDAAPSLQPSTTPLPSTGICSRAVPPPQSASSAPLQAEALRFRYASGSRRQACPCRAPSPPAPPGATWTGAATAMPSTKASTTYSSPGSPSSRPLPCSTPRDAPSAIPCSRPSTATCRAFRRRHSSLACATSSSPVPDACT